MRAQIALGFVAMLTACADGGAPPPGAVGDAVPNSPAFEAAAGDKYRMESLIGIGDIVIGEAFLTTSDGQQIPIRKVADGLYAFPEPPSALTNGQNFCFSKPVTGFTWHKHAEGLWVMNVGDWRQAPTVPNADTWAAEGGCGLSTYKPDGA